MQFPRGDRSDDAINLIGRKRWCAPVSVDEIDELDRDVYVKAAKQVTCEAGEEIIASTLRHPVTQRCKPFSRGRG
jgi:hypothetical protein